MYKWFRGSGEELVWNIVVILDGWVWSRVGGWIWLIYGEGVCSDGELIFCFGWGIIVFIFVYFVWCVS